MKVDGCNFIAKEVESILNPQHWELSPQEMESILNIGEGKKGELPVDVDHKGQPVNTWWPTQAIERELSVVLILRFPDSSSLSLSLSEHSTSVSVLALT
jgi:hypothetical protein